MNMQNKIDTIQFPYHLMTDLQPVPEQQLQNPELMDLHIMWNPPKRTISQKSSISQTREALNSQKRG